MLQFSLGKLSSLLRNLQPLTRYSHITTNPTSYIVTIAEHAAAKILALAGSGGKPTSSAGPIQSSAKPTSAKPSNTPAPSKAVTSAKPATPTSKPAEAVSAYPNLTARERSF